MSSRHRRWGVAALLGSCALTATCGPNRPDATLVLAPTLSSEVAAHLAADDPDELRRFGRRIGRTAWVSAVIALLRSPPTSSLQEFARVEGALAPSVQRLVDVLNAEFDVAFLRSSVAAYRRRELAERLEIVAVIQDIDAFTAEASMPLEQRAERLSRIIERGKPYADAVNVSDLYGIYASMLPQLGRRDEMPHYLRLGIDSALEYGDHAMACQLLGTLGVYYNGVGDFDAMRSAWDRALAYARRIDSWQEARILTFYGTYYRSRGQLAITRDLVLEAQDRCRALDATEAELRFVIDALQFFASLDCWDVVGKGLRRADMVLRQSRSRLSAAEIELEATRLQVLRARYCATIGRCEDAHELALSAAARVQGWSLGPHRAAVIHRDAARALTRCGFAAAARPFLEHGLRQCTALGLSEVADDYAIELAQVYLTLGDLDACERLLASTSPPEGSRESVQHGILQLRLSMLQHDRPVSLARLQVALRRLDAMADTMGASPERDIAIAGCDGLRRLGHDLVAVSPEAAYAFEMRWRTPAARRPRAGPLDAADSAFVPALAAQGRRACARLAGRDAVHCIYDVRDDAVVRMTADARGITTERLDVAPGDLRAHIQRVRAALGKPSPPSPSEALLADLRQLATWLLPESLLRSTGTPLFLVTANDCLARLPFETLNVGAGGYVSLLARADVASVRFWNDDVVRTRGDSALVVSAPIYAPQLRRRHSILNETLPVSAAEAAYVRQLLPRSTGLTAEAATKRNVLDRWEKACVLYFAGHLVQDPEVPYVMFIPMSETPGGHEDDWYLEVADVRGADLARAHLVVLSSCASGAPYTSGRVDGASFADVFIDAGARAVVSTAWAVRDDVAAHTMSSFMRRYAERDADPIGALCQARREVAAENPDPHTWAAYSITVAELPPAAADPLARAARSGTSPSRVAAAEKHR